MFKRYFPWLLLPLISLFVVGLYTVLKNGIPKSENRFSVNKDIATDRKLVRTLDYLKNQPDRPEQTVYIGYDGLKINLQLEDSEWAALKVEDNVKYFKTHRHDMVITVNDFKPLPGSYKIRGDGSIKKAYNDGMPERLNYNISLFKSLNFAPGIKLKKFFLMSLISDPHCIEGEFAYRILKNLGLFPSHTQFVAMEVNNLALGLYYLIERPRDAILRTNENVVAIYRRNTNYPKADRISFVTEYQQKERIEKWHIKRLYHLIREKKGVPLMNAMEKFFNLEQYLTWLAFNSLVLNRDSFDEIFFYIVESDRFPEGRIELMAWDYDDINLKEKPGHPKLAIKDPLLFSCEGELDRVIQREPVLYRRFMETYHRLLTRVLTKEKLRETSQSVFHDVQKLRTGLSPQLDKSFKEERKIYVQNFEKRLLKRYNDVLAMLTEMYAKDAS
jgi:hypothetical protein